MVRFFVTAMLLSALAGCPGPVSGPICGDANGDGLVTAHDITLVLEAAVGLAECKPCICDVNGDGTVTSADAKAIALDVPLVCPPCS